ncbi:hypothetical protein [Stratiformator vulcanicus]|uniref:HTH HARE-type domain-containing protein n=1 Tax=Stratiformator vulcanicus TaxID=2527980 RepID=A0A517R1B7_9PLAN|nr:hypothetical protein [Stratiformator vulcanicus]QDT37689.1 hypothetical protein Pan189_20710 [Stratiformator vulcanicus]
MDFSTEKIEHALREELTPLDAEAEQLRARLHHIDEQRNRLNAALAALAGGGGSRPRKRPAKPAATKAEVIDIIAGLLREQPALPVDELQKQIKEKLTKELGRSLNGFALRFKEATADRRFQRSSDGLISLS